MNGIVNTKDGSVEYLVEVTEELCPGDIFPAIPFPLLRYPLKSYRPDEKAKRDNKVQVFAADGKHKPGDIAHCAYHPLSVMLLSHGCEIDKTLAPEKSQKLHLLVAPVEELNGKVSPEFEQRVREGRQPNRLYLPKSPLLGNTEHCVDLRRILPVPSQYLLDAKDDRLATLNVNAKYDLSAQIGIFFSGLAIYLQDIECPNCGIEINAKDFLVSSDEGDDDPYIS
jgi:hypothetical protein